MAQVNREALLKDFEKYRVNDFSRKGSDFEFIECDTRLKRVANILNEAKDTIPISLHGKDDLETQIYNAIEEFNGICHEILNFNTNERDPNQTARGIRQKCRHLYNKIFIPTSNNTYSSLLSIANQRILEKTDLADISDSIEQIEKYKNQASKLLSEIRDKSRSKFAHDYSEIFHHEAINHSRFSIKKSQNKKIDKRGLGYAELYLILGLFFILLLFGLVFYNYFIPNHNDLANNLDEAKELGLNAITFTQILIPFYVKKLIILGVLIYSIRFCFRQYSIHKHLYTLNKHRANTLDSFEFFYNNLEESEVDSKDQYLIEVAKSIFKTGETGFIKSDSNEPTSLIENFKFLKGQI